MPPLKSEAGSEEGEKWFLLGYHVHTCTPLTSAYYTTYKGTLVVSKWTNVIRSSFRDTLDAFHPHTPCVANSHSTTPDYYMPFICLSQVLVEAVDPARQGGWREGPLRVGVARCFGRVRL